MDYVDKQRCHGCCEISYTPLQLEICQRQKKEYISLDLCGWGCFGLWYQRKFGKNIIKQQFTNEIASKKIEVKLPSKTRGVHFVESTGRWRARISYKGKKISLGCFNTKTAARQAYEEKRIILFGE